jgi:hypothetical protein
MKTFNKIVKPYLYKVSYKGKCCVCNELTYYIDKKTGQLVCCNECLKKANNGLFEATHKGKD